MTLPELTAKIRGLSDPKYWQDLSDYPPYQSNLNWLANQLEKYAAKVNLHQICAYLNEFGGVQIEWGSTPYRINLEVAFAEQLELYASNIALHDSLVCEYGLYEMEKALDKINEIILSWENNQMIFR